MSGKVLVSKQIAGNENISVIKLPKGVYVARIVTASGIVERKLVKE